MSGENMFLWMDCPRTTLRDWPKHRMFRIMVLPWVNPKTVLEHPQLVLARIEGRKEGDETLDVHVTSLDGTLMGQKCGVVGLTAAEAWAEAEFCRVSRFQLETAKLTGDEKAYQAWAAEQAVMLLARKAEGERWVAERKEREAMAS